jgi:hypothetical protein
MAKAYRARVDVSFPRVIAVVKRQGEDDLHETEGVNYSAGSYILEENLTPRDRARAEAGELDHLIEPVDREEADRGGYHDEPEFGVFVAEHEAEAHALEQYGHHVIPREQELEALSSGAQYAADYQRAVRDAGYDRRPAQEAMAQERERVPEGLLAGSETRTGTPFNRGPEDYSSQQSAQQGQEGGEEEQQPSPRPRPGSQEFGQEQQYGQPEGNEEEQ